MEFWQEVQLEAVPAQVEHGDTHPEHTFPFGCTGDGQVDKHLFPSYKYRLPEQLVQLVMSTEHVEHSLEQAVQICAKEMYPLGQSVTHVRLSKSD